MTSDKPANYAFAEKPPAYYDAKNAQTVFAAAISAKDATTTIAARENLEQARLDLRSGTTKLPAGHPKLLDNYAQAIKPLEKLRAEFTKTGQTAAIGPFDSAAKPAAYINLATQLENEIGAAKERLATAKSQAANPQPLSSANIPNVVKELANPILAKLKAVFNSAKVQDPSTHAAITTSRGSSNGAKGK